VIGAVLAVAILLFGLKGALGRLVESLLAARRSRKVFERAFPEARGRFHDLVAT